MVTKKRYYDPKRTKEIQEAGQSMGVAMTYLGLIVVGMLVIIDAYYYITNHQSASYSPAFMAGIGLITLLVLMAVVIDLTRRFKKKTK
ncbi:MAG: hypothetical protein ACI32Q_02310 [Intestinibaculum porci]|uniref:hypothetical protein n=1 Tax=Intestinibaculum porci TaxID=2487118 RepID=UPI003F0142E9